LQDRQNSWQAGLAEPELATLACRTAGAVATVATAANSVWLQKKTCMQNSDAALLKAAAGAGAGAGAGAAYHHHVPVS
jgi:hypothetical protein